MMEENIAAIATAPGKGGVAIIRISGKSPLAKRGRRSFERAFPYPEGGKTALRSNVYQLWVYRFAQRGYSPLVYRVRKRGIYLEGFGNGRNFRLRKTVIFLIYEKYSFPLL